MHGVNLISAPEDWEILQQEKGSAQVKLKGTYQVHPAAINVGVAQAVPMVRVMRESDNMTVSPWTMADVIDAGENFTGSFETVLRIPEGGLYRIETSLETRSTVPNLTWLYRGDCVLHLGVGDLFIIAGQSNSAGYGRDFCEDPSHICVHLFRNRGKWDLASHPMNESTFGGALPNEEMGIPGVSPYLTFGRTYYELTGRPVGLVQTSMGGSPISRWMPETGDLYQNMLNRIYMTGGKYAGVLWYQGCSDTEPEQAAQYLKHFRDYAEALRRDLGYEIPIFTMQLNRQINGINDVCWGMVRDAQRRAALEIPNVHVLSTTNLGLCDGIHNNAPSSVALGKKLAKQCVHVLAGGEEYEAPSLSTVQRVMEEEKKAMKLTGIWLKLCFDHVKNCLQIASGLGKDSGFTLEDSEGEVEILSIRANREDRNYVYLELAREAGRETFLSFAWQADPVKIPVIDEVTFLPPLSFYRYPILRKEQ